MNERIFVLQHAYEYGDEMENEEVKLLGVYATEHQAKEAIKRYKTLEGFCDYPEDCFFISNFVVGADTNWKEGFVSSSKISIDFKLLTKCFNDWLGIDNNPIEKSWDDDIYYDVICSVHENIYKLKNATELAKYIKDTINVQNSLQKK